MPVKKAAPEKKSDPKKVERAQAPSHGKDAPLRQTSPAVAQPMEAGASERTRTDEQLVRQLECELKASREALQSTIAELKAEMKERQLVEQALRASEQKFRTLFQDAPVGISQSDPHDGRFLLVNPRFCSMTGYSESELLGRSFSEITHPDDRGVELERFSRLAHGKAPRYQIEKRYIRKDGTPVWAEVKVILVRDDAHGNPLHTLEVISDISERMLLQTKLAEHSAQLQRERNFIEAILNTVGALIMVVDLEGRLVRSNGMCSTVSGYDLAEFVGKADWQAMIPEDEREGVRRVIGRLVAGEDHIVHENNWRRRDGSLRLINWRNTVLKDETGRVQYVIGTGLDITEQHQAEIRARETLEEASRLQRLQTANELATLLAHELNQPLAAIASYAEAGQQLLRHTPLEQDKLTRNLDQISQQSLRAGEAIRHLRAFVGRGRIDPVPLDLNSLVRDTGALMVPKVRSRGIDLVLDLDETLPQVMGVGIHIEQVLLNLLRNAIDAIRDAGMTKGNIAVSTRQQDGMARVSVCDSGPGIEAAQADKVFDPLASRKEYGLGIGLRISRSLIEAHGGKLWVEPHRPGGIFHFVLPLVP